MDSEMEWNGNGNQMEKIITWVWNWGGMEWNIQWNLPGRGMEMEWKEMKFLDGIRMEWNGSGMEWNGNGITMEYAHETTT